MQLEKQNENNNNSSKQLLESEEVENTPFKITGNKETGYYITMGQYVLTENPQDDKRALLKLIHNKDWKFICALIATLVEHILKAELEKAMDFNERIQKHTQNLKEKIG